MQRNIEAPSTVLRALSEKNHQTDVVIIGAGPVGLFAIFELGMLGIKAHVVDSLPELGGQCTALYPEKPIYDIPGFPSIDAGDLITNLAKQAAPFAPTYHLGQQVVKIESRVESRESSKENSSFTSPFPSLNTNSLVFKDGKGASHAESSQASPHNTLDSRLSTLDSPWHITTNKGTIIHAKAILIAAGCGAFGPNRPPIAGLESYEGSHVHYMVSRKEQFRGQRLVIAGGGDSAVDWANALSDVAEHIYVVHRRDKFRAAPESVAQMKAKPNVEMVIPYQLEGLEGNGKTLSGIIVSTLEGEKKTLPADHLLAFFGLSMELGPIANWGLDLAGTHIAVDRGTCATSTPGIFAIGDIAMYEHKLKLILCGFCEAALAAHAIRNIIFPDTAYHFEYSTSKGVAAA